MKGMFRAVLLASASLVSVQAYAGGFINSSQSTVGNGMAYAGAAAPGSSSAATLFMNPATMTGFRGFTMDSNYTFGVPSSKSTGSYSAAGAGINALLPGQGSYGMNYFVPATYLVYQLNNNIWAGLSINSTYGNSTKSDGLWRGSLLASTTKLRAITATPSLAYKFNDMLSFGVGLQIQYITARQTVAFPAGLGLPSPGAGIMKADGWGFGVTAGLTFTPRKGTQIGLGWRSLVEQNVEGETRFGPLTSNNSKGTLNLPNRVNLSLRQTVTERLDILGSIEWQNWGRIGNARLKNPPPGPGAALAVLPFGYSDGWFFSLGAEYRATDALTVRAGIGYEISPVKDSVRRLSLPDSDRLWLSTGFTYDVSERFSLNASYSYLHFQKAPITQVLVPGITFTGESKQNAHLLSIGLTSRWGAGPKKEDPLVRKF
ncbi:MAG: OmpP1/FadL family transporter [Rhabdaerophilum sp.]